MTIRAVIDTSSLFSHKLREKLTEAAKDQKFVPVWSPWIIAELNRILTWDWIDKPHKDLAPGDLSAKNRQACSRAAKIMMEHLIPYFVVVDPRPPYPPVWEDFKDLDDLPILAAALLAKAQYVISQNTKHFPPEASDGRYVHEGIEYITGENFLALLETISLAGPTP